MKSELKKSDPEQKYKDLDEQVNIIKQQKEYLEMMNQFINLEKEHKQLNVEFTTLKQERDILHNIVQQNPQYNECYELKKERDILFKLFEGIKYNLTLLKAERTQEELLEGLNQHFIDIADERDILKKECADLKYELDRIRKAIHSHSDDDYY